MEFDMRRRIVLVRKCMYARAEAISKTVNTHTIRYNLMGECNVGALKHMPESNVKWNRG